MYSLLDLIDNIKKSFANVPNAPMHYIFSNTYVFLDNEGPLFGRPTTPPPSTKLISTTQYLTSNLEGFLESHLTVLKYRNKAPISAPGYSVKSIIDPQACVQMHNHFCWSMTQQFTDHLLTNLIDSSLGVNQHYKYCHLSVAECKELLRQSTNDNIMLKYRDKLVKNVADKIREIFGNSRHVLLQLL